MGLDSKDLKECLSQMLAVGGKKEKAVLRNSTRHTEDEFGQKKNKNGKRLSICIRVQGTRYFRNENDARLSLDFVCSVVVPFILGSTMMPRNVLNWF